MPSITPTTTPTTTPSSVPSPAPTAAPTACVDEFANCVNLIDVFGLACDIDLCASCNHNRAGQCDLTCAFCGDGEKYTEAINQLVAEQRAFCAQADASALQNSLVITSVMYALPALFFLLCMKTLQKDLVSK